MLGKELDKTQSLSLKNSLTNNRTHQGKIVEREMDVVGENYTLANVAKTGKEGWASFKWALDVKRKH